MPSTNPHFPFRVIIYIIGALGLCILFEPSAFANAGLPMLQVVFPASFLLLFLIVPLEAYVGAKCLKVKFFVALQISFYANIFSTLIGIPITWMVLVGFELLLGGGSGFGESTFSQLFLTATIGSPWLPISIGSPRWLIPAAGCSLCIPFFFMSFWFEFLFAKRFADGKHDRVLLKKWFWEANRLSYGLIFAALLLTAFLQRNEIIQPN